MTVAMVEHARSGKAPFVGIPIAGAEPFIVRSDLLRDTLKGLTVIDAAIQMTLDPRELGQRRLVVCAVGKGVQAIRRFVPVTRQHCLLRQYEWAEAQRKKRAAPAVRVTAREKQIARLRKQLTKLGKPRVPIHPLLDHGEREVCYRRQSDARELAAWQHLVADSSACERPLTHGEQWARWKREARIRRWIQVQARECRAGKIDMRKLYVRLAERGITAQKWSKLNTRQKESCKDVFGYLTRLWEFCGLADKPRWYFEPYRMPKIGATFYRDWLEHLYEYKELESMIAGLEEVGR